MRIFQRISILLVIFGLWVLAGTASATSVGFVTSLKGSAQVESAAGGAPKKIAQDAGVSTGDTLATEGGSSLKVLLEDDTILLLGADTQVVIDRLVLGKGATTERSIVRSNRGHLRVNVGHAFGGSTRLEIQTPIALVDARGTVVEVVTSKGSAGPETLVVSIEGVVKVRNSNGAVTGTVDVSPGMSTLVRVGNAPTPPGAPPPTFHALAGVPLREKVAGSQNSVVLGREEDKALVDATEMRLLKQETLDTTNRVGKSVGPAEAFEGAVDSNRPR